MIVYIDSDYRCHLENDGTMRQVETKFFDGKCKAFIEGFRFIPNEETWVRPDGVVITGQISPAKNYDSLVAAQQQYEADQAQMSDMQNALEILGVSP